MRMSEGMRMESNKELLLNDAPNARMETGR